MVGIRNIKVSKAIALSVNKMNKDNDLRCFEATISEVREQLTAMYMLNDCLTSSKESIQRAISEKNENSLTVLLYTIRQVVNNQWVELPLHKYKLYRSLFDKYHNDQIEIFLASIKTDELEAHIKEIRDLYLKEAVSLQHQMKMYFCQIEKFLKFSNKDVNYILNHLQSQDSKKAYLFDNKIGITIDWNECQKVWSGFSKTIDQYKSNYMNMSQYIENSAILKELKVLKPESELE